MKKLIELTYLATRGGYVAIRDGSRPSSIVTQRIYEGETGAPVHALPKRGMVFFGWSDGVKSNPRRDVAKQKIEIYAFFQSKYWIGRLFRRVFGCRNVTHS